MKKIIFICECCGQQFESTENVGFCNECENHWIWD